jgi:hypothetical protein
VVAGGLMLASSSSTKNPANNTEKGTEVAEELFEGNLLAEDLKFDLSTIEGGKMVGMEVEGCGSGLHSIATEVEQNGFLSELVVAH